MSKMKVVIVIEESGYKIFIDDAKSILEKKDFNDMMEHLNKAQSYIVIHDITGVRYKVIDFPMMEMNPVNRGILHVNNHLLYPIGEPDYEWEYLYIDEDSELFDLQDAYFNPKIGILGVEHIPKFNFSGYKKEELL